MMKWDKKGIILCWLFSLLFICFFASGAGAQAETCVTAKCHAQMGKDKVIHPAMQNGCATCHAVTQEPHEKKTKHPGNLTISLTQNGAELCYMCHEPKNKKKVVHAPVMGGDCTSCHNPHQSPNKGMLKVAMPQLCFQCHSGDMVKHKVMHPPVAAGDCSGCHDNHESDFQNRLVADGNELCFSCHPDKQEGLKTKKVLHSPVKQSCTQCHNPHGSPNKSMLSLAVPDLCSNCHPTEASLTQKAVVKHGPMIDAKACMNCHDPHFSDNARLLPLSQEDLCLSCHNKQLDTGRGAIADMKSWLEANKNGHGPVRENNCVGCHNPHGSDYWRILWRYYPSDFYTSYSDGKYALCFACHDKAAFKSIRTEEHETNFRNGTRNLHFVHVNKSEKGRTCRSCHEVHADMGVSKHIRERVGFSYWSMPINFIPNKNGGSCSPGCHGEKQYAR